MKFKKILSFIGCTLLIFTSVSTNLSNCFANGGKYITEIYVDIHNVNNIEKKLYELCNQFNHSHGIQTDETLSALKESAYQYFFGSSYRYNYIPSDEKLIFAQCIEAMYLNKDNPVWHNIIKEMLTLVSLHGRHNIQMDIYMIHHICKSLNSFLHDNGID